MARARPSSAPSNAPPTATDLNLFALEDALAETPDGVIRKVSTTSAPHLRRCIAAGLLAPAPGETHAWCLSPAGVSTLAARRARALSSFAGYRPQFLNRDLLMQLMAHAVRAEALSTAESVVFLFCWDRPSTVAEALTTLGLPLVLAAALAPGRFAVSRGHEPFTLDVLLKAHRDLSVMPADITAIAALAPGESYELRLGSGATIVRCVGEPPRQPCSPLARRLSNVLALYGKVLHGQ